MTRRKLPIGLQTFRTLREEGYYYVDKTPYIQWLVAEGTRYFLSHPRRLGKSLFLDTLKELSEGSEALCAGLDIHPHWAWSVRHPVLHLDFSAHWFETATPTFLVQTLFQRRVTSVSLGEHWGVVVGV